MRSALFLEAVGVDRAGQGPSRRSSRRSSRLRLAGASAFFLLVACAPVEEPESSASEPGWRSALYPRDWRPGLRDDQGRGLHDFSYAGYRGGEEPPVVEGPRFDVTDLGADPTGEADSTEAVQATIDQAEAAGGGVVYFPEGLYRLDEVLTVSASGVVLRGEGPTRSKLAFTRSHLMSDRAMITIGHRLEHGPHIALTLDASDFDTQLRTADAVALPVGTQIAVGWEISPEFVEEHGMTDVWTRFAGTWRPFFRREVVGRDPSSGGITLDVPMRYSALRRDGASVRVETGHVYEVGIESLGLSTAVDWSEAWQSDRSHAVLLRGVVDGWVRDVSSFESPFAENSRERHLQSGGIKVEASKRVTIADTDLRLAQNRGPGGNGYLFEVTTSSEILIRDSVGVAGRHNFIQNWDFGTSGCVWLRVRSSEGRAINASNTSVGWLGASEYHHSLAMANLVDSSEIDDAWYAVNRGTASSGAGHTSTESAFWNLSGEGLIRSYQFGHGYVIGTRGVETWVDFDKPDLLNEHQGTAPEDWLEGEGEGAELYPQSLYEDQRARRLGL